MTQKPNEWMKLPGLFFQWEIEPISQLGDDFHIEKTGKDFQGTPLYAVYHRRHNRQGEE